MQKIQTDNQTEQAVFQETVALVFERSLTEEQRFLQGVMAGKIKLIPHEEVIEKLTSVLKNGLQRK